MGFVSKIGDIVTLESGEGFIVVDCIEYNNEAYLKIANVTNINNVSQYVDGFVKETITPDGQLFFNIVTNRNVISDLEKIIENLKSQRT